MQKFDVLVVGGGASGLRAAIAAGKTGASVALISKIHPLRSHSAIAHGGLNAPLGKEDSPEQFANDTLLAGDGLSDSAVVKAFAGEAAEETRWLDRMGVPFNRDPDGRIDLRRFGSNGRNRTCYADDRTGHIVLQVLHEQFLRAAIPAFEDWYVTSLVVDDGTCVGLTAIEMRSGKLEPFHARAVVLATGGFGRIYHPSVASLGTTGDGLAMALNSGISLRNMEMVQYHPTVLSGSQPLLLTEASLGEGAKIVNAAGEFVPGTEGSPRHAICVAMRRAAEDGGEGLFLDFRPVDKEKLTSRLPETQELVRAVSGLDIRKDPVPISPTVHRAMGGIDTNLNGETSVRGLFAVGGCAANGLHGAGRLAGNSLSEAVVFGKRVGEQAGRYAKESPAKLFPLVTLSDQEKRLASMASNEDSNDSAGKLRSELRNLMESHVGLLRDGGGLKEALTKIGAFKDRFKKLGIRSASKVYNYEILSRMELESMLHLAEAVTLSAEARRESRGAHKRTDFPERDDRNWRAHTLIGTARGSLTVGQRPLSD